MEFGDTRIPERVWRKIDQDESGCWLWKGSTTDGYGMTLRYSRSERPSRNDLVHRWMLEVKTGAVGVQALHSCRKRNCVNPEHLRWGTNSDNQFDAVKDGTHVSKRKTHCPQGHEYNEENTLVRGNRRICLTCKREQDKIRSRTYRARKRGNRCLSHTNVNVGC
jgi:hypothetical protein